MAHVAPLHAGEDTMAVSQYWKPFADHAAAQVVADHPNGVIDFGAGHSVYEDAGLMARVQRTLAPLEYVLLILPSPNVDRAIAILNERSSRLLRPEMGKSDAALLTRNEKFVRHPPNAQLAKMTGNPEGWTPEAVAAGLVRQLRGQPV